MVRKSSAMLLAFLMSCADSEFKASVDSKSVPIVQAPSSDAVVETPVPDPVVTESPPEVQIEDVSLVPEDVALPLPANCDQANANILKSDPIKLNFPARTKCSFGMGENLPAKQSTLTAMEKTTRSIPVPKGATICGIHMESDPAAKFRYDDVMVMTLDKSHILFASTDNLLKEEFVGPKPADGIHQWDWLKVRGRTEAEGLKYSGTPYCLNEKNCIIPNTEATGPINVSFEKSDFLPISAQIFNKESIDLDLIVMGDNDSVDCMHRDLDLSVTFDYIPSK